MSPGRNSSPTIRRIAASQAPDSGVAGEGLSTAVEVPFVSKLRLGVCGLDNWLQLVRFAAVGASGYAVNLGVFATCVHPLGLDYRISAVIAFVVSVCNNFWLNRHWTFGARDDHPGGQAIRFFAVYVLTFGFAYGVLVALVDGAGLPEVLAQAIANACAAPPSFAGQKLWTFRA